MVVYRKEVNDLDPPAGNTAAQSIEETSSNGEKPANTNTHMVSRAILTSRPNSHPFQERYLTLDQPVKIGRSVARCRPAPNNAIFDCKVLSRNHALLWYENGKFYLQDTKSSNGTFVNNQRLSKGSEESPAREVCSGDIVQFGVDVVENSRKDEGSTSAVCKSYHKTLAKYECDEGQQHIDQELKIVHGCVVATLKLFLPDGKEAKASPTTAVVPCTLDASVSSQELYLLSQYLQEALHREQVLENKLGTLQKVVANTQDESDIGWKALIAEDRLLSRIEILESQLQTCGKNVTEEKLRDDVLKLQDDKDKYQNAAKESLKKVLQEKLDAIRKVQDLESSLSNAETECSYLRELNKNTEQEIQNLLEKNTEHEKEIVDLTKKLQEAEDKYQELVNQAAEEKIEIETKVEDMKKTEESLSAKIEALEAENDFSKEQLESLKARFDMYKKGSQAEEKPEKNGLLPCEDELESSGKDIMEKKGLIQELSSEVNRLELELQRVVEENNKNEVPMTIKYKENEEYQTNGDIKSSDYINHLQLEIQQLKNQNSESEMSLQYMACTVTLLQELLTEARESKKTIDAELVSLKSQFDEVQNNAEKLHDEFMSAQEQLSLAKQQLKEKSEEVAKLESQLSLLSGAAGDGHSADDVKEKEEEEEEEVAKEKNRAEESALLENLRAQLTATEQQLKESQNESHQMRKKLEDLVEEVQKKKVDNKTVSEIQNLREECTRHHTRIQVLESEIRKYRNENTRLDADNKYLQDVCAKLEAAKLALENQSDDYWKEQVTNAKVNTDRLSDQLAQALREIVLIKERYAECNDEKAFLQKEKDAIHEQLQLLSVRSRASYACCVIPVLVLLLATVLAFYPSLAHLTATSDQT